MTPSNFLLETCVKNKCDFYSTFYLFNKGEEKQIPGYMINISINNFVLKTEKGR